MEGQRKGSAMVLNDYMGLKLLRWGGGEVGGAEQEVDVQVIQKQRSKQCAPTDVGVDRSNYYVAGVQAAVTYHACSFQFTLKGILTSI